MSAEPTLLAEPQWATRWQRSVQSQGSSVPNASCQLPPQKPMWEFCGDGDVRIGTHRAVPVVVTREGPNDELDEQVYLLSCERLHVFAAATNYWDAERRFKQQVAHYYFHYTAARPEDLDEDAQDIQRIYMQNFYVKDERV